MPILDVDKARTVMVIKRSMAAFISPVLITRSTSDRTLMLFGTLKISSAISNKVSANSPVSDGHR